MNTRKVFKELARQDEVRAMREGRVLRAQTFANRKKTASKNACRKSARAQWA